MGARVLVILVALAFLFWFYQKIDANFQRQALIEDKEFGALREELDDDFTGREIATVNGPVLLYAYSKKQDLEDMMFDEASDHTLVDARTGKERRLAGDDRRVVWFRTVDREIPRPDAKEDEPQIERQAFAYVARLATRQMYLDGTSDLVVGNMATLEQRKVVEGVSFIDAVLPGEGENEVSILLWLGPEKARHLVVDTNTLQIVRSRDLGLPEAQTFLLDQEERNREAHHKGDDSTVPMPVAIERPRPQRPKP